ncbi:hybrid sensor histidine kinase/response regulator [Carboxylicivirga linearis]|nr:hybrid sensor histidine kinase/response regulator [Carboxylicivirga linearis]
MKSSVLIVDDNPKNLQVLAALLFDNNYEVEIASSGKDAITWTEKRAFDAILLDIMMPEMNGFETCKVIKSNKKTDHIPIIFLTARHDVESIEEGFIAGGIDYITKPFNQSELLIRLKTHIELKKSKEKLIDVNSWLNTEVDKKTIELRTANKQLKELNVQLSQLDEAKNYFLNSVSHEIRTPLNGIIGAISLLKAYEHNDNILEIINLLDSSIKKMEKYSFSALQISQLHLKGVSQLVLKPLSIKPIIKSILQQYEGKASDKGIQLSIESNSADIEINADYKLLHTAIVSLLECSLAFTGKGEIKIEVTTQEENILISIIDTGSPYDDIKIQHFFNSIENQNYQFKRTNSIELYLTNLITLLHKGRLELNNRKEIEGTKTTISIPFFQSDL